MAEHQAAWYRRMWADAADAVGATVEELGSRYLKIGRDGKDTVVAGHHVMLDHPATISLALDKPLVHELAAGRGVPLPDWIAVPQGDLAAGVKFLRAEAGRYVVKPADGAGGGGVTPSVETVDDLRRAWMGAAQLSGRVMVERAEAGQEFRLLFLDGRLLDAVRREPPAVQGDGRATAAELIAAENRRRLDRAGSDEVTRLLHVDLDCELSLRHAGYPLRSVLPDGARVAVKTAVSDNARAENVTVRDLAPAIVETAADAAGATHLRLAGVDVIARDPQRPLGGGNGAVLEVNGTPGLHYHYQVADPEHATAVAVPVLEELLAAR